MWVGTSREGAKYWQQVLTEIKNRGVKDACIVVSDGLTGLSESITATWPEAIHQTCVLHYADLGIMPMWSPDPLQGKRSGLLRSA